MLVKRCSLLRHHSFHLDPTSVTFQVLFAAAPLNRPATPIHRKDPSAFGKIFLRHSACAVKYLDPLKGGLSLLKNLLSLVLAAFLFQTSTLAQSPLAPADATKSIQQAQSIADAALLTPNPIREIKLPAGTPIDIESAYTVSSLNLRPNEYLSFRVLIPIKVDGVTIIEKDALATARVVEAKRGRHWGKAGRLSWTMLDVIAIDGTRIPLHVQQDLPNGRDGIKGTSHGAEVATKTIVMGAILAPLFPIAPLALMSGFRRGEDAILPEGKRFVVFVQGDTVVKVSAVR